MDSINFTIDGQPVTAARGRSVLEAALDAGIYIPHLCYHPDLPPVDACQLCVVEIEGMEGLPTSCTTPAAEGMVVKTGTESVIRKRHAAISRILSGHPADCGTCNKYLKCELQALKQYLETDKLDIVRRARLFPVDKSNPLFIFDPNKCVLCTRCIRACRDLRGVGILVQKKKGEEEYIGTVSDLPLAESGCRFCGACAEVCPTGAILDKEELTAGKNRKTALVPCRYTCPAEIDVPGYLRFIREKNYPAACALIREKVPFPEVLGYVCDRPCESVCRRGYINQPVSIRELKRFAAEQDIVKAWKKNINKKPATGKRAAIIGSGPAGLTAAYFLVLQGHEVTVFESLPRAGGMLRTGIPEYRLPRDVLDREIREIEALGVEIRTGCGIESLDGLFEKGYQAVLVAVGTQAGIKLPVPGAGHSDILAGVDFLRRYNLGEKVSTGRRVIVLGGGNVAFDCARVSLRLGAGNVRIVCLESRESLPASGDEIEQGEEEGIEIYPSRSFTRIITGNGRITGVELQEVLSFSFTEDGKLQVEVREDSLQVLEADTVIFAVGQKPQIPAGYGINVTGGNLVEVDEYTLATSREGVFAAGDAVSGTSSVIRAIASGRKAAVAIDRYLGGDGEVGYKLIAAPEPARFLGLEAGFAGRQRCKDSLAAPEERIQSCCPVVRGMDEESAAYESKRCLQCDLRLKITPVKIWSNF